MHIYIEGIACLSHLLAFHSAHVWEGGREVGRENLYLSPVEKTHFGELRAKPSTANTQGPHSTALEILYMPHHSCKNQAYMQSDPQQTHIDETRH
jgi:hypothetical protein